MWERRWPQGQGGGERRRSWSEGREEERGGGRSGEGCEGRGERRGEVCAVKGWVEERVGRAEKRGVRVEAERRSQAKGARGARPALRRRRHRWPMDDHRWSVSVEHFLPPLRPPRRTLRGHGMDGWVVGSELRRGAGLRHGQGWLRKRRLDLARLPLPRPPSPLTPAPVPPRSPQLLSHLDSAVSALTGPPAEIGHCGSGSMVRSVSHCVRLVTADHGQVTLRDHGKESVQT